MDFKQICLYITDVAQILNLFYPIKSKIKSGILSLHFKETNRDTVAPIYKILMQYDSQDHILLTLSTIIRNKCYFYKLLEESSVL